MNCNLTEYIQHIMELCGGHNPFTIARMKDQVLLIFAPGDCPLVAVFKQGRLVREYAVNVEGVVIHQQGDVINND